MKTSATIRIGISGWSYSGWRGVFYPKRLRHDDELAFAARRFGSIEINSTFYRLQRPESFARWHDDTPPGFIFAVKGPRYITHMLRLARIETALANFMASGVLRLQSKLGPMLWQFPARARFDAARLDAFLGALPRDTEAALGLARRHDARVAARAWLEIDRKRPLRHAIEIRNDSFRVPAFIELLRRHRVALVCADTVEWPLLGDLTADFVYCRLHGAKELYVSGYGDKALDRWARRVRCWAEGGEPADIERVAPPAPRRRAARDVYLYFDNDAKVRAPADAARLARRLGIAPDALQFRRLPVRAAHARLTRL